MAEYDGEVNLRANLTPGDIRKVASELTSWFQRIFKSGKNSELSSSLMQAEVSVGKLTQKAAELSSTLSELESQRIPTEQFQELLDYYDQLERENDELSEKLLKAMDALREFHANSGYEELKNDEAIYERLVSESEARLAQLKQEITSAGGSWSENQNYLDRIKTYELELSTLENIRQKIADVEAQEQTLVDKANEANDAWEISNQQLSNTANLVEKLSSDDAAFIDPTTTEEYQKYATELNNVNNQLTIQKKKLEEKSEAQNQDTKSVTKATRAHKSFHSGLGMGFKKILRYAFGIRSLFVLFNRLCAALKEGFGNLQKEYSSVNDVMVEFKASTTYLKNSIAAAFRPLAEYLIPKISQGIQFLVGYIEKIGITIARFMGRDTYTRAIFKLSDGLEETAQSAKDARLQLAGFDELNNIGSSDSGLQDAVDSAQHMFEEVALDGPGLNLSAENIGKFFSNLLEKGIGLIDGTKIGKALTDVISWALDSVNAFLEKTDWGDLGFVLGNELSKLFGNVDGNSILQKLMRVVSNIFTALGDFIFDGLIPGIFGSSANKKKIEDLMGLQSEIKNLKKNIDDLTTSYDTQVGDIQATYDTYRNLADKFFELAGKETLTKEELEKYEDIRKTLSDKLPGFDAIIGDTTKTYDEQREAVTKLIDETEKYYLKRASEEFLVEQYKNIIKARSEMAKANEEWDKYRDIYTKGLSGPFDKKLWDGTWAAAKKANEAWGDANSALKTAEDEYQRVYDSIYGVRDASIDAARAERDTVTKAKAAASEFRSHMHGGAAAFDEVVEEGKAAGKELVASFTQSGQDSARGLVDGVESELKKNTGRLRQTAKDLILDPIQDRLKIQSPSKVFRDEVGAMIPAGIVEGIEDGSLQAARKMRELGDTLANQNLGLPGVVAGKVVPTSYYESSAYAGATLGGQFDGSRLEMLLMELIDAVNTKDFSLVSNASAGKWVAKSLQAYKGVTG